MFDEETGETLTMANFGYYGNLTGIEQAMLLRNNKISSELKNRNFEGVKAVLSNYETMKKTKLSAELEISEIMTISKDSEYEANYAVIKL